MKNRIFISLIIIFFLITFLIFYKGLQNTNIYIPNVSTKKDIPYFEAKLFGVDRFVNSNEIFEKDKFYLINIWASWCVPCREEHPFLMNLKDETKINIIGLNYKDNNENAKRFIKELNNPYNIILSDKDGIIAIEWGAYGVPETFLIYDKKIIKKFIGPLNLDSLSEIKKLIK